MEGICTTPFNTHPEDDGIRPYSSLESAVLANDNATEESYFPSWTWHPVIPPCTYGILQVLHSIVAAFRADESQGVSKVCFRAPPCRGPSSVGGWFPVAWSSHASEMQFRPLAAHSENRQLSRSRIGFSCWGLLQYQYDISERNVSWIR